MAGHWSVKTFWEDGNETNDWPRTDEYEVARAWAVRMRGLKGVVGVMLERWEYQHDGNSRLASREQVYA